MLNDKTKTRNGNMTPKLMAKVDELVDEFMTVVNAMVDDRHLQKGIARSQLPSSMVVVLDNENLSILAQFRMENRFSSYFCNSSIALTSQQASNSAQWEFGMDDAFVIQFPKELLEQSLEQRHSSLEKIASDHIDSEFKRFMELLSLMRTRPIFGQAPLMAGPRSICLLMPQEEGLRRNHEVILRSINANGIVADEAEDIRKGKSSIHEMWYSLNEAAIIIADLTGPDAGVMYGLGIAHTIGKETILIQPKGSKYLTDIPRTHKIEYEDSDAGRALLQEQLEERLQSMMQMISNE